MPDLCGRKSKRAQLFTATKQERDSKKEIQCHMNHPMTHQRMTQSHFHQSKTSTCHQLQLPNCNFNSKLLEKQFIRATTATRQKISAVTSTLIFYRWFLAGGKTSAGLLVRAERCLRAPKMCLELLDFRDAARSRLKKKNRYRLCDKR